MAAVDFFLKLDGIEGESADDKHKNEIDVHSWSIGAQNQGTGATGGGSGAGKVHFNDFHFTMHVSKATPKLMLHCAHGGHIAKGVLICRKAGKQQQEYLKITLSNILVSSYQTGGSGHSSVMPVDTISLNFSKIEYEYKPQKADGSLDAAVKAGYDIGANKPV
jgi:type VI secretion system secreted protein Hcp